MQTSPTRQLLAHSSWDLVPVILGLLHLAGVVALLLAFPRLGWSGFIGFGLLYSVSISWNINSISHNFIHNPYFNSAWLNRAFSFLLSVTMAFSQVMYHYVHMRHHSGNMDRPDEKGDTVDLLSIYRHGKNGQPESPLAYTFLSYFRDDPVGIYRAIRRRQPAEAAWALAEIAAVIALYGAIAIYDWRFVLCMLPFYYLGHSLSSLNGFYEHFGADPNVPIAWGVSSYNRLYNLTWLNNGYHAEHHYRPAAHWTGMPALHAKIASQQRAAGVKVIRWPHALGFLDRG